MLYKEAYAETILSLMRDDGLSIQVLLLTTR